MGGRMDGQMDGGWKWMRRGQRGEGVDEWAWEEISAKQAEWATWEGKQVGGQ